MSGWKIWQGRPYQDPLGFFLTPRRTFVDDPLMVKPYHPWMAWQWLIQACVYEGGGRDIWREGCLVHLERGQCLYSLRYLERCWGWSRGRVRRFLLNLEGAGRIRYSSPNVIQQEDPGRELVTVPGGGTAAVRIRGGRHHQKPLLTRSEHNTAPPTDHHLRRHAAHPLGDAPAHLGRVITVVNYDPYQDVGFYFGTTLETPSGTRKRNRAAQRTGRRRDSRGPTAVPNRKEVKKEKEGGHRTPELSTYPQGSPPPPLTWDSIRAAVSLGIWPQLPGEIQRAQVQEATENEGPPPEDLRLLLNGSITTTDADTLTRLRQIRDRLTKGEPHDTGNR